MTDETPKKEPPKKKPAAKKPAPKKAVAKATSSLPGNGSFSLGMGYNLPAKAEFEDWEADGEKLFEMAHKVPFLMGDWLNAGEDRFGEMYAQAIDLTKLAYSTLAQYKWVCGAIPVKRRVAALSFGHHVAVAGLEPDKQDEMLKQALREGWSRKDLRKAVRALGAFSGGGAENVDGEVVSGTNKDNSVTCPRCGGTGWVSKDSIKNVPDEALDQDGEEPSGDTKGPAFDPDNMPWQ